MSCICQRYNKRRCDDDDDDDDDDGGILRSGKYHIADRITQMLT